MEQKTPTYPLFYRLENRCMKRDSDTTGIEVLVPESYRQSLPVCHGPVTFPSKERLDEEVSKMEPVDQEIYEQYIFKHAQHAIENTERLKQIRLQRYTKAKGLE